MKTIEELKETRSKARTMLMNMVRRVVVKSLKATRIAQLDGFVGAYGEQEVDRAPWMNGIGILGIPPTSAKVEGVVLSIGGASGHPVLVAVRDTSTAIPGGDPAADETVVYNSLARVIVKANGEVLVDDGSGAVALALKSDVDNLRTFVFNQFDGPNGHHHVVSGAATTTQTTSTGGTAPTPVVPAAVVGTTKLKGK